MKMFHLEQETKNVWQRNVACFVHVECRIDKIKENFQGFGSLVSLQLHKDGSAKSTQIWTKLWYWNTGSPSPLCEELLFFFNLFVNAKLGKHDIVTAVIFYYTTTSFITRNVTLAFQHLKVLALRSVIFLTKISKFWLKCLLLFFSIHNTSILWKVRVMFHLMKLGRYVIVNDGANINMSYFMSWTFA